MTTPTPHPSIARLEPLIGRWRIGEPGAGGDVEFAWLGDNAFVVQRWRSDPPEFPDGIALIGPAAGGDGFVQHYFDTRGVERRYEMSLRRRRVAPVARRRRLRPAVRRPFSPDGSTIEGAWEIAMDRTTFEHDFDLTYTRVAPDLLALARASYGAYETGDRSVLEDLLADDFVFYSPPDPGIDRVAYFERCWPNHELHKRFAYERLQEIGNGEVLVTYEAERTDGSRFRNTEVLRFEGDKLTRAEVYFGWNLSISSACAPAPRRAAHRRTRAPGAARRPRASARTGAATAPRRPAGSSGSRASWPASRRGVRVTASPAATRPRIASGSRVR